MNSSNVLVWKSWSIQCWTKIFEEITKCYVCDKPVTKNGIYNEHIILNAIGGRLSCNWLICQSCARRIDSIDTELAKQLDFLGNFLNIKRHRGEPQSIKAELTESKKKIALDPGVMTTPRLYQPEIEVLEQDGYASISIAAGNEKQLRQVLTGLKRKYQNLDIEKEMTRIVREQIKLDEPAHFVRSPGNANFYRSVCKMAVNFYIYSGGERHIVKHIVPYLRGETAQGYVKEFYPEHDFLPDFLASRRVCHSIFLGGSKAENILYSVICLYGVFQYVILLSEEYAGLDCCELYSFDVSTSSQINFEHVDYQHFTRDEVFSILNKEVGSSIDAMQSKLNQLMIFIQEKQRVDLALEQASQRCRSNTAQNMSNDELLNIACHEFNKSLLELITRTHG